MNGIQPLRFITRAVLPLVYDESLSYYEFLCKVLDKLNIVITNSNTQSEAIKALNTELKNFEASTDAKFLEYQANVERLFDEVEAKLNLKENTANKTQIITDSSTEAQYPSAKAVNEVIKALNTELNSKEDVANKTQTITDSSTEAQYPSAKAVLEYVKAHAGGGADIVSFDFPHGQESVTYDTTDGITMTGQARLTDSNGKTNDVATDISIPIFSGQGIAIGAKSDNTGVVITNTNIIGLGYSNIEQTIVITINDADIAAKYDDYNNVISTTYATKTELNNKLDKTTNGLKVYATDDIGNQTTIDYTDDILPNSIPLRNTSGNLAGNAPVANNDYTTKSYVDNKAEAWTFTLDDGSTVVKNVLVN